ncbi:MAG: reverse transcriptase domain-containing protein [Pirellulales bacterium]
MNETQITTIGNSTQPQLRWSDIYNEAELYKAAVRLYTKPLFDWRKALTTSTDQGTLYDFARHGLKNLHALHGSLSSRQFRFSPCLGLAKNFNGKHRTLYIYPWKDRLVSLLLYRLLNRAFDSRLSHYCYAYRVGGYGVNRCQQDIIAALRSADQRVYVSKRDIANYFASVDHDQLLQLLAEMVDPDDYLYEMLTSCVRFSATTEEVTTQATCGIPFGTAIACLFANLYLMRLDQRLEALPKAQFFRYADDLLVLSPDAETQQQAGQIFDEELARLKLSSKPSHERDFVLTKQPSGNTELPECDRFRHLGLEFRADGSIGLSRDKFRKLCNLFRFAFRRNQRRFDRIKDPMKRAKLAVEIAGKTIGQGVRNVAIIDYYLGHVTDEGQLKQLDRWLAEEVLAIAFQKGHKKGYFRLLPFAKLREMGLPSLVHRRRLILHQHIETPFFIWKSRKTQRGYGGKVAKPVPS